MNEVLQLVTLSKFYLRLFNRKHLSIHFRKMPNATAFGVRKITLQAVRLFLENQLKNVLTFL